MELNLETPAIIIILIQSPLLSCRMAAITNVNHHTSSQATGRGIPSVPHNKKHDIFSSQYANTFLVKVADNENIMELYINNMLVRGTDACDVS